MDIFGIGVPEIIFVLILALIIMGPKDMAKAGRTIGRNLRRLVTSENWRTLQDASREIRNLPNRLMREAGIEDLEKQLPSASAIRKELGVDEIKRDMNRWQNDLQKDLTDWTTPPTIGTPPSSPESILPKATSEESGDSASQPGQQPAPETRDTEEAADSSTTEQN